MKRRLAIIMVLALMLSVLGSISVISSALVPETKEVTYHYQFDGSKAAFWAVGQVFTNNADFKDLKAKEEDGVLLMANTCGIRDWNTIGYYLGGKDKIQGTRFGFSVDFTLPEEGLIEGAKLNLLVPLTGGGSIDDGFAIKDGVLYSGPETMEVISELENGKTYTVEMIFDFVLVDWPVIDTFVYDADGNVVAKSEARMDPEMAPYFVGHLHSIGFRLYDHNENPVVVDNFKVFKLVEAEEAPTYTVTVNEGTASAAKAEAGTTITVTANAAPAGKVFDKWVGEGVTFADATAASTTFAMPQSNVTVTATYKDAPVVPADTYTVTVNGVEAEYEAGQTVTVSAEAKEGYVFLKWNVEGVEVEDVTAETISFQMPAGNVTLNAEYRATPGDEFPVAAIAALAIFSVMGMAVLSFRKREA